MEKQKQKESKLKETSEFLKGLIRKPLKTEEEVGYFLFN